MYKEDLDKLNRLDPVIITPIDIGILTVLRMKYNLDSEVTKGNFIKMLGELGSTILESLEELAIDHVLESEREDHPGKKSDKREKAETLPKVISEREG